MVESNESDTAKFKLDIAHFLKAVSRIILLSKSGVNN